MKLLELTVLMNKIILQITIRPTKMAQINPEIKPQNTERSLKTSKDFSTKQ